MLRSPLALWQPVLCPFAIPCFKSFASHAQERRVARSENGVTPVRIDFIWQWDERPTRENAELEHRGVL